MALPVYLDHHATTPCDPAVVQAMLPYFTEHFGNASSRAHTYGLMASAAADLARERVAALIGAEAREVVFTSGATESNNLAILGLADANPDRKHVVTCATEHHAVLDVVRWLGDRGWDVTVLPPDPDGTLPPDRVAAALRPDTLLVSVMAANNEIGTLHDLFAIGAVCRAAGVLLHTDAAQAVGKVPVDVRTLPVDLLSFTAHKLYGPKGIGALWVRARGRPRVSLAPRQHGGGQERGLRSGTLPVPLAVGFGVAAELAGKDLASGGPAHRATLRDRLWAGLADLPGVHLTGSRTHRLPENLHVRVDGARGAALVAAVKDRAACSTGSACSADPPRPSHVLEALGLGPDAASSALRLGVGRWTTEADIDVAIDAIRGAVTTVRGAVR